MDMNDEPTFDNNTAGDSMGSPMSDDSCFAGDTPSGAWTAPTAPPTDEIAHNMQMEDAPTLATPAGPLEFQTMSDGEFQRDGDSYWLPGGKPVND